MDVKKKLKYTSRSWRTYCYYIQIWRNILFSKNLDVEKRKKKDPRCRKREKNKSTAAIILDVKRYKKNTSPLQNLLLAEFSAQSQNSMQGMPSRLCRKFMT
jgi:hypothetical protein